MSKDYNELGAGIYRLLTESDQPITVAQIMGHFNLTYPESLECLLVVGTTVQLEFTSKEKELSAVRIK